MFRAADINGSKYCGPTSLSCVSGIGTKEICKIVRHLDSRRKRIRGMYNREMEKVLDYLNIGWKLLNFKKCTLSNWVEGYRRTGATYILNVSRHYLVLKDDKVVCTQFKGEIGELKNSKYLRCRVNKVWMVLSEPSGVVNIPEPAVVEKRASYRGKKKLAVELCEKYGIDMDDADYIDSKGERSIWVYLPDKWIDECFGGEDPWDDDHYACDYEEVVEKIQDLQTLLSDIHNKKLPVTSKSGLTVTLDLSKYL